MNLHLNRRLEVLAREIAEAKKPRINASESIAFDLASRSPQYKTLGDLKSASYEMTAEELAADLADASHATAGAGLIGVSPPSTEPGVKFRVGDKFRVKNDFENLFPINEFVAHRVVDGGQVWAIDPNGKVDGFFWAHNIELIEPAPSPDAETVGEWMSCSEDMPDLPAFSYEYRYRNSNDVSESGNYSLHTNMRVGKGLFYVSNYEYRRIA